jgi:hypothetical protein
MSNISRIFGRPWRAHCLQQKGELENESIGCKQAVSYYLFIIEKTARRRSRRAGSAALRMAVHGDVVGRLAEVRGLTEAGA